MSPSLLGQLCILTAATSSNHAVYWKFFVLEYVESLTRNFRSKFSLMQVNNLQSNWYITIRLCDAKACVIHAKLSRSSMVLCSHCKCNVWSTNSCGKYRFTPSYYYYFIIFFFVTLINVWSSAFQHNLCPFAFYALNGECESIIQYLFPYFISSTKSNETCDGYLY